MGVEFKAVCLGPSAKRQEFPAGPPEFQWNLGGRAEFQWNLHMSEALLARLLHACMTTLVFVCCCVCVCVCV